MKKTVIFIVGLGLVITLLTATPAKAHWSFFWPGFAVGIGTAVIAVDPFFYHSGYYYPAPPVVYGGGYAYYGGADYRGYHSWVDPMAATPGAIVVNTMAVDIMVDKTMAAGIGDSWVKDYNVR